jgi:hypothetical protein
VERIEKRTHIAEERLRLLQPRKVHRILDQQQFRVHQPQV